jgi:(2R)-ethylmalonyl-CoA mutase
LLERTRRERDPGRVERALEALRAAARSGAELMEPSIECALARVTTGEWAGALRDVFGEYRPHTGIEGQRLGLGGERVDRLRARVGGLSATLGHRPRLLIGKPGLDGHSNGAEVIAVSARHVGFEVVYSGIRLSAGEIVTSAIEEGVDLVGASVLSGSHLELARQIVDGLREQGAGDVPVVLGGIVPASDLDKLIEIGVARIFTPADYELIDIMETIADIIEAGAGTGAR